MTCDGSTSRLNSGGHGHIVSLSCCPPIITQLHELTEQWKISRKDLISTIPIPFGVASFGTASLIVISGPPKPGDTARMTSAGITVQPPSGPNRPPDSTPINESYN